VEFLFFFIQAQNRSWAVYKCKNCPGKSKSIIVLSSKIGHCAKFHLNRKMGSGLNQRYKICGTIIIHPYILSKINKKKTFKRYATIYNKIYLVLFGIRKMKVQRTSENQIWIHTSKTAIVMSVLSARWCLFKVPSRLLFGENIMRIRNKSINKGKKMLTKEK
jgi:hypothetical protein